MKSFKRGELLLLLLATLPACGQQLVEFPETDGASPDAGMANVLILNSSISDAAIADVPTLDAPRADAATIDADSTDGAGPGPLVTNAMPSPTIGATACGRSMAGAWAGNTRGVHLRLEHDFRAGPWVPALVAVSRST
jgi:predicted small lipoprotein YifL